jgi:hypothetical protein
VKKNVSTPANALQEVASQFPGDLLQAIPDIDENTKATRAEVLKVVVAYHKALNAFAESAAQAGSTVTSLDGTIKSDLKAIADEQKTLSASIAAIKQPTTDLFGAAGNIQKDIDGQLARAKQKLDQNPTDADAKTQYAAIQKLNNTAKQAAASAAALSGGVDPSSTKSDVGKALSDYNTASASFNSGVASFSTSTKAYEAATKKFGPQLTSYVSGIENAAATLDGSPKATAVTISALTATFNGNVATVKLATDQWVKDYNNLQSQTEDYIKQKKALEKAVVDNSTKYETALKSDVDAYDQLKTKVNSFAGAPTGTISPAGAVDAQAARRCAIGYNSRGCRPCKLPQSSPTLPERGLEGLAGPNQTSHRAAHNLGHNRSVNAVARVRTHDCIDLQTIPRSGC